MNWFLEVNKQLQKVQTAHEYFSDRNKSCHVVNLRMRGTVAG